MGESCNLKFDTKKPYLCSGGRVYCPVSDYWENNCDYLGTEVSCMVDGERAILRECFHGKVKALDLHNGYKRVERVQ